MSGSKPRLALISPVFLFPNDTGGRIRTTNILRGLKGGAFEITLISPATDGQQTEWASRLREVCDHFVGWHPPRTRARWMRAADLMSPLPVNVVADRTRAALKVVHETLAITRFDVVVFDFVHASVLRPPRLDAATVCFTHNVEAEIFARHAGQTRHPIMRSVWATQHRKMEHFERAELRRYTTVVAVSERDAQHFRERYGIERTVTIPTGVDLDYFFWTEPVDAPAEPTVVFTGSMDWDANQDAVKYFLSDIWPLIRARVPSARFKVVGRNPPAALLEQARGSSNLEVTGFVDDVRPHVRASQVFALPLRVGGGTRIKAFEAMAMGCPMVSTAIGVEGLDVTDGLHYLQRDNATDFANAVVELLGNIERRRELSRQARQCVEQRFGHRVAAQVFEKACLQAMAERNRDPQLTAKPL